MDAFGLSLSSRFDIDDIYIRHMRLMLRLLWSSTVVGGRYAICADPGVTHVVARIFPAVPSLCLMTVRV